MKWPRFSLFFWTDATKEGWRAWQDCLFFGVSKAKNFSWTKMGEQPATLAAGRVFLTFRATGGLDYGHQMIWKSGDWEGGEPHHVITLCKAPVFVVVSFFFFFFPCLSRRVNICRLHEFCLKCIATRVVCLTQGLNFRSVVRFGVPTRCDGVWVTNHADAVFASFLFATLSLFTENRPDTFCLCLFLFVFLNMVVNSFS